MRILWVVNHYMADLAKELGKPTPISGSWLVETSKKLKSFNDIELNIVCPSEFDNEVKTIDGINYYLLKMNSIDKYIKPTKKLSESCVNLLAEIKPNIIHIQGSEFAFGLEFLLQKDIPVVISIQGLISEIVKKHYTWAGLKDNKNYLSINNIIIQLPQTVKNIRNKFRAKAEIKQLKLCDYIIGRTIWDRAHSYFHNPSSKYYVLQEAMRDMFFKTEWDFTKVNNYTIFCAGGYGSPLKGAHKVLEAVALLKSEFPNIELRIPGRDPRLVKNNYGYNRYIVKCIRKLQLDKNVKFVGHLNEIQMAEEFSKAHAYVMGSSIENSSNTMGEAMCVGTPSIISYVGGLPSLANDEKEVLFYRFGDVEHMSWQIRRIFKDENLANMLSRNARERSFSQYPTENISKNLKIIYEDIIVSNSLQ